MIYYAFDVTNWYTAFINKTFSLLMREHDLN